VSYICVMERPPRDSGKLGVRCQMRAIALAENRRRTVWNPTDQPIPYCLASCQPLPDDLPFTSLPTQDEFVWALEKDVRWVICELRDNGADGLEVLLAHDGGASTSQPFDARVQAMSHADMIRKLLERDGWRLVACTN
jgi:hypothetical protein